MSLLILHFWVFIDGATSEVAIAFFFCSVAGKTRQNSINLYFCGGRYISSCPDDSTLLMITAGYQVCGRFERKWLGNG